MSDGAGVKADGANAGPSLFVGEFYSYTDARRRVPSAWRDGVDVAPKGLGHFERSGLTWVYVAPNGYARPVRENYGKAEPPPLPRPASERSVAVCHDGPHRCTACGQPNYIEIHGVNDGFCTYCYHA